MGPNHPGLSPVARVGPPGMYFACIPSHGTLCSTTLGWEDDGPMTTEHGMTPRQPNPAQPLRRSAIADGTPRHGGWQHLLFPEPPRVLPYARALSIAFRTVHIAAIGILLGGHVFALPAARVLPWLYLSIISGVGLIGIELYSSCKWFYQGKGVLVLVKLLLLAAVAVFWEQRVWLLLVVLLIGSLGSHMPGRFRYYSLIHHRGV